MCGTVPRNRLGTVSRDGSGTFSQNRSAEKFQLHKRPPLTTRETSNMDQLTIREAARKLGISPQALRSRAKHRGVQLEKVPGPHGDRYLINTVDLSLLGDDTVPRNGSNDSSNGSAEPSRRAVSSEVGETVSQDGPMIPLSAHLEVIQLLRETQRNLQEAQEQRHKSHEATQLLERQTMALKWELSNYHRALSENAESLAEHLAHARQVEYQVQEAELKAEQALAEKQALAEENQKQKEEFEKEKSTLTDGLKTKSRASWIKSPQWVRKLFGTA